METEEEKGQRNKGGGCLRRRGGPGLVGRGEDRNERTGGRARRRRQKGREWMESLWKKGQGNEVFWRTLGRRMRVKGIFRR